MKADLAFIFMALFVLYFGAKLFIMDMLRTRVLKAINRYNIMLRSKYCDYNYMYESKRISPKEVETVGYCTFIRFWDWSYEQFVPRYIWDKIKRYLEV